MMKIYYNIFLLSLCYFHISIAQSYGWIRTYGTANEERGFYLLEAEDNSIVVVGCRVEDDLNSKDSYAMKVNQHGDVIWTLQLFDNAFSQRVHAATLTDEGDILMMSDVRNGSDRDQNGFRLIKISADGTLLWKKKYPIKDFDSIGFEGAILNEGGGAYTILVHDSKGNLLIRTKQDTVVQWMKQLNIPDRQTETDVISPTLDGGYILAGTAVVNQENSFDVYIIKADSAGNQEWYRTFGDEKKEQGQSIFQLATGEYILSGQGDLEGDNDRSSFLMKLSETGEELWRREYIANALYGGGLSVLTTDGNIVFSAGGSGTDYTFCKYDQEGKELWQQTHEVNTSGTYLFGGISTSDGGVAFTGISFEPISSSTIDIILIKLNKEGLPTRTTSLLEDVAVKVFPNPSHGLVYFNTNLQQTATLSIFDAQARLVQRTEITPQQKTISLNHLPTGALFYQLAVSGRIVKLGKILNY